MSHRAHRLALLQQQFGDRAPDPADAARRAGDQNGIRHNPRLGLERADTAPKPLPPYRRLWPRPDEVLPETSDRVGVPRFDLRLATFLFK
jgi:hypothetical protein